MVTVVTPLDTLVMMEIAALEDSNKRLRAILGWMKIMYNRESVHGRAAVN